MERLLELLNAFETPKSWIVFKSYDDYDWTFYWIDCDWETEVAWSDALICSKKNLFIKWLIENDKIETNNLSLQAFKNIFSGGWFVEVSDLEVLLMLLAISDTPIEDLISYLK